MRVIFGVLVLAVVLGMAIRNWRQTVDVKTDRLQGPKDCGRMFVTVHGIGGLFSSGSHAMAPVNRLLNDHGCVVALSYGSWLLSNARPDDIATKIAEQIRASWDANGQPQKVVLVGSSIGALLVRRAYLDDRGEGWASAVERIVLLAGMNRGWDLTGHKPDDMRAHRRFFYSMGAALARLTGLGRLMLDMEAGAPFVANLRLKWMANSVVANEGVGATAVRSGFPPIVQLLGDIDDVVSDDDNKDLASAGSTGFAWLRVRGTGHRDITDVLPPGNDAGLTVGTQGDFQRGLREYRGAKLTMAATEDLTKVKGESEELPPSTDPSVTDVVFVVHGIRDYGEWASMFETAIQKHAHASKRRAAVVSARYGYFGMGPFLLAIRRAEYVRWLMDEYTEARGRYPNATRIHFFGHSNGTYLLATALEQYKELRVDNVAFAGSVVRKDYDWRKRVASASFSTAQPPPQVKRVRNYVASDDLVVALFPRVFELRLTRWLRNDVGSAGFNGFDDGNSLEGLKPGHGDMTPEPSVENVGFLTGGHGAFVKKIDEIAKFLVQAPGQAPEPSQVTDRHGRILQLWSDWLPWTVWLMLAAIVVGTGLAIGAAAREWALMAVTTYTAFVIWLLRNI